MSGGDLNDPRESSEDDFAEDKKGIGARISWIVLGVILLCVLGAAYSLDGFWWQS